jgi:hypothetical protein
MFKSIISFLSILSLIFTSNTYISLYFCNRLSINYFIEYFIRLVFIKGPIRFTIGSIIKHFIRYLIKLHLGFLDSIAIENQQPFSCYKLFQTKKAWDKFININQDLKL